MTFQLYSDRGANMSYVCDKTAGPGSFTWVSLPPSGGSPPYYWVFEWKTSYACPAGGGGGGGGGGSSGISGGWVFIIVYVVVCLSDCASLASSPSPPYRHSRPLMAVLVSVYLSG